MTGIYELINRWNSPEGRPHKGSLIDWDAYGKDGEEPPDNIGCMCAQGQALHLLAGWTPARLRSAQLMAADRATARLFNISHAHAVLLRQVNDDVDGAPAVVLTHPEKILGDQAPAVLAFWLYLETMTTRRWKAAIAAWRAAGNAVWIAAVSAAGRSAVAADWGNAGSAAAIAAISTDALAAAIGAGNPARSAKESASAASNEIQGARIMREQGAPFFFLPMFGFATPEDIPPLPDNYGIAGIETE